MSKKIKLHDLHIRRYSYGDPLKGSITFFTSTGETTCNLKQHHIDKILNIVSDAIIEIAEETSRILKSDILEQTSITSSAAIMIEAIEGVLKK